MSPGNTPALRCQNTSKGYLLASIVSLPVRDEHSDGCVGIYSGKRGLDKV